mmetsp:Transcript_14096/g.41995  ORF Transcript_14096/g.41995 Transcript_14096/m.41995 type:complete len:248 (+) Transcript_14096:318-1061(+)
MDESVELRRELPGGGSHGACHDEDREEEGPVFEDALHPWLPLVVHEKYRDRLRRLHQEDDGVHEVGKEGLRPHLQGHGTPVLLGLVLLDEAAALEPLPPPELRDVPQGGARPPGLSLCGPLLHGGPGHPHGRDHAEEVDGSLPEHGDEDGRVEERAQRPHGVHAVARRRVGKGQGRRGQEPVRCHHLPFRAARALKRQGRQHVGIDDAVEHHDLLLLQGAQQRAPPLPYEINAVLDGRCLGGERRGD